MIDYKNIEKIHPMVLFTIFVLAITVILPLFFLSPQPSTTESFQTDAVSGSFTYQLENKQIALTLTITSFNTNSFSGSPAKFYFNINFNSKFSHSFNFVIDNFSQIVFPYTSNKTIYLTQDQSFNSSFEIKTHLLIYSGTTLLNEFDSFTAIGHPDHLVADKWLIISFTSLFIIWMLPIIYLKRKTTFSLTLIIKDYSKGVYESYENLKDLINDNSYFIMFFAPALILFIFLYHIYIHFSLLTATTLLFFESKIMVVFLLSLHVLLLILFPSIANYILDYFKGTNLERKNRIKDNMIFTPLLLCFYLIGFLLIRSDSTEIMFTLLVVAAFLFNSLIYYQSMKYHSKKYNYNFKSTSLLFIAVGNRFLYLILLFLSLQLFLFSTNYPVNLLLF